MRVAFVVGSFPEISETFILDQMTDLIDRGHEVMILARPPADPNGRRHAAVDEYGLVQRTWYWDRPRGGRGAVLSRTGSLLLGHPLRTVAEMGRCLPALGRGANLVRLWSRASMVQTAPTPDVFFAQFGTNGVLAQQVRDILRLRVPLVTNFLGYDLSQLLRQRKPDFYARLFARGELMLPLSNFFRERLLSIGCPPDKIRVQRIGVDTALFAFRERSREAGAPTRFVSLSRLVEKKGLETGLRAFALLREEAPSATWDIVGDGPLRPQLEEMRRALALTDRVVLRGAMPREAVRQVLDESHILLAPSVTAANGDQEGTPVAIMEGMAVGLPVVSTRHSGIPELVQDGVTGLLVPERDPEALAHALRQLATAPERWGDMGRRGRAVVEREYNARLLGDRLAEILMDVVRRQS